jgi:hypothetical protein
VESVNALLVALLFSQLLGRCSGRVLTACGEVIELRCLPVFVEDHYAKW